MGQALAQIFENALNHLKGDPAVTPPYPITYSCIAIAEAYSEYRTDLELAGLVNEPWGYEYGCAVENVVNFVADQGLAGSRNAFSGGVMRGATRQERQMARALWITWLAELAEDDEIERMMGDEYPKCLREFEQAHSKYLKRKNQ